MPNYYHMSLQSASEVTSRVWQRQNRDGKAPSIFRVASVGSDATVSTEDAQAEQLLVAVLTALDIKHTVGDAPKVLTGHEYLFAGKEPFRPLKPSGRSFQPRKPEEREDTREILRPHTWPEEG